MAYKDVPDHPKFNRLKVLLKANKLTALGILEGLWHFTGRFAPTGYVGKYEPAEIEAWLEWDGQEGHLIAALVKSKWLEDHPVHGLIVHDWEDWAPNWVHVELAKKALLFVSGTPPKIAHDAFNSETRNRIRAEYVKKYGSSIFPTASSSQQQSPGLVPDQSQTETAKTPDMSQAKPNLTQPILKDPPSREQEVIAAREGCSLDEGTVSGLPKRAEVITLPVLNLPAVLDPPPNAPTRYSFTHPTIIAEFQQEIWPIWKDLYPSDELDARKEFAKARNEATLVEIKDGADRYRAYIEAGGDGGKPKKLKNWLAAKGWEEDWTAPPIRNPAQVRRNSRKETVSETIDRLRQAR